MQVNNSASSAQNFNVQPLERSTQTERSNAVRQNNVRTDESRENPVERVERIESSEKAIAQLEQTLQSSGFNTNQQGTQEQTSYDQPSRRNNTALSVYQSVDSLEQRENVQQLLGVDVYA